MAEITASMVMDLRGRTGLPMMECKKALTEAAGDLGKAEELLRIRSGAKALKAADRVAAEGVIGAFIAADGKTGAMLELNCETDFVARNVDFVAFARALARLVAEKNPADVAALSTFAYASGDVEAARRALVQKLGENVSVRRFVRVASPGHVPHELIERERAIYTAQAAQSGKPAEIVAKMVEGRINKFLSEVTLLGQPFVKNPDESVEKYLKARGASVKSFELYVVGEGIDKKKDDFAAEVAAMARTA